MVWTCHIVYLVTHWQSLSLVTLEAVTLKATATAHTSLSVDTHFHLCLGVQRWTIGCVCVLISFHIFFEAFLHASNIYWSSFPSAPSSNSPKHAETYSLPVSCPEVLSRMHLVWFSYHFSLISVLWYLLVVLFHISSGSDKIQHLMFMLATYILCQLKKIYLFSFVWDRVLLPQVDLELLSLPQLSKDKDYEFVSPHLENCCLFVSDVVLFNFVNLREI